MKIAIISDTHNKLAAIDVPAADLLIHCGDFCSYGKLDEVARFSQEMSRLPHKHKLIVAGNHDWPFQRSSQAARALLSDFIYLEDEMVEIDGLKIYGSPWQPTFMNWAFNLPRGSKELAEKWQKIPEGVDVLVTHGPPFGILDRTNFGKHVGCELLLERVSSIKPRLHCFGHIHEAYGKAEKHESLFVNAAVLNSIYRVANKPVLLDLA